MKLIEFPIPTEEAQKRISIAKEFLDKLKEKMGDCFYYAYLYGSTAENTPRVDSDIDIIVMVRKPTQEERTFMNTVEGGLWGGEREGRINFARNSHYFFILCHELVEKYHIEISPYYHYKEEGVRAKIRETPFSLIDILRGPILIYPNDFKDIVYL